MAKTNSVDLSRLQEQSDLSLHYLLKPVCPNTLMFYSTMQDHGILLSPLHAKNTLFFPRNTIHSLSFSVVVLCASADSVREIMIKAHDLNFDNGEYVFFNIDLFSR